MPNLVRVSLDNSQTYVRYCSFLNTWLDFVVIVDKDDADAAVAAVDEGMSEYWDGDDESYGEAVERHLKDIGVKATVIYRSSSEESEEYEDSWEELCAAMGKPFAILNP